MTQGAVRSIRDGLRGPQGALAEKGHSITTSSQNPLECERGVNQKDECLGQKCAEHNQGTLCTRGRKAQQAGRATEEECAGTDNNVPYEVKVKVGELR